MLKKYFMLNLHKFDGAATGGTSDGGAAPSGDTSTPAAGEKQGDKVIYGKQPDKPKETAQAAAEKKATVTSDPEAKRAEYQKLIQGEYKDFYTKDTQEMINRRFKETKTLETQLKDMKPVTDMLFIKYGITDGDVTKLARAVQADNSLIEEQATNAGLTVEQYRHQMQIERENEELRKQTQQIEAQREAQETYSKWVQQGEELKATYPMFNLDTEIRNLKTGQQFIDLLKATGSVKTAYQAIHFDEILPTAMQTTAQKVQEATVNNIQSRNSRPVENGVNSSTGVIMKNDPSKLTDADIDEIKRRVRNGETIRF